MPHKYSIVKSAINIIQYFIANVLHTWQTGYFDKVIISPRPCFKFIHHKIIYYKKRYSYHGTSSLFSSLLFQLSSIGEKLIGHIKSLYRHKWIFLAWSTNISLEIWNKKKKLWYKHCCAINYLGVSCLMCICRVNFLHASVSPFSSSTLFNSRAVHDFTASSF